MMRNCRATILSLLFLAAAIPAAGLDGHLHHELSVILDVDYHEIQAFDRINFNDAVRPGPLGSYRFLLHADLHPRVVASDWTLIQEPGPPDLASFGFDSAGAAGLVPLKAWQLVPEPGEKAPYLSWKGEIHHPVELSGGDYQRGFSQTPGIIGKDGVFLSGATFWVPVFNDRLVTFDLWNATLEAPWTIVSQGKRTVASKPDLPEGAVEVHWECHKPVEEIYLVAGPWHEYSSRVGEVELLAFLREDDPALADKYLEAATRFIGMYEAMLTPYPWPSFALVENFWDTGYGMPGFTLLGPRIIRFPWILTSSYPHEILHNWWGNSTYIDFGSGNWAEGLTAYMADHMFAEQRGEGGIHRRATLQKYTDFVRESKDFALSDFRSRHSAASEAVGYGKSLMLFHMIRREVGDEAFLGALARFHRDHLYSAASFGDLARAFTEETGRDWGPFFEAWTGREGAPEIEIADLETISREDGGWGVQFRLAQTQSGSPFPATIPVAVTVEGREEAVVVDYPSTPEPQKHRFDLPGRPLRLDVDPAFDVMRRLDPMEVPPALSTLFGEDDPVYVLPSGAPPDEMEAWRALAARWQGDGEPRFVMDSDLEDLPEGTVWLLGRGNALRQEVWRPLTDAIAAEKELAFGRGEVGLRIDRSLVLVARRAGDPRAAVGWVTAERVAAIPGLARKLPHYTRYSWLAFKGDAPDNTGKGMWEADGSPLTRKLAPGTLTPLRLPERAPLSTPPPAFDAGSLRAAVEALAAPEMEGRGLGTEGLGRATAWVEAKLDDLGLEPAGGNGFRQTWSWRGGEPERDMELSNLLARKPGTDPDLANRPVLVMAHLDHLGLGWPDVREDYAGQVHPGADDNASGVAVLLEVAGKIAEAAPAKRPVLFAVVTGEEAGLLGSRHLLESLGDAPPSACLNLDTVGRLGDGKLLVLESGSAREWKFIWMGIEHTTGVPVSTAAEPLDSSDQAACLEKGVPAVQIFTGPHPDYHRPGDTAEKIDAGGMARVAEAILEAVRYLADRVEPLTAAGAAPKPAGGALHGARRVSLGTMPDFTYGGPGVKVQQVMPGSPAEAAGILPGDLVTSLAGEPVTDLRSYSQRLKACEPGQEVEIVLERAGESVKVRAVLGAR